MYLLITDKYAAGGVVDGKLAVFEAGVIFRRFGGNEF